MLRPIHAEILRRALDGTFSARGLNAIISANLDQDNLNGWLWHDEFHFDNSAFDESYAYIEQQRALIGPALERGQLESAWQAFGRLTHVVQDFYAHSNYVELWLSRADGRKPAPADIDSLDADLLAHPALCSGKLYYPLEALSFLSGLDKWVRPFLPHDSHTWMNLDSAECGPMFNYAFDAAVKRTKHEFDEMGRRLDSNLLSSFKDVITT